MKGVDHRAVFWIPFLVTIILFSVFVFTFEYHSMQVAKRQLDEHARIIGDDLWHFNHPSAVEYLKLAANTSHYQHVSVVYKNGQIFEEVFSNTPTLWERVGIRLQLVHRVLLSSPVRYNKRSIGRIEAIWLPQTLFPSVLVFSFMNLLLIIFFLYQRVSREKIFLEEKVRERTEDLYEQKIEGELINKYLESVSNEFQALLDNSPVGILFNDFNRVIKRVNSEITRITGYLPEELIGGTTRIFYESKEIYEKHGRRNYPVLKREGFLQMDSEILRKDGTPVLCRWHARVITGVHDISGVVWILEDISLQQKMEKEILRVKKLESVGVLAGGIAHDFNNLLMAILGNISLAATMTRDNENVQEFLAIAEKASNRAKDLTSKLLTFASGGEPVKTAESLPQLLEDSASFVLSGSNVMCLYEFDDDVWPVKMDKGQINQVTQNLVLNAKQSMASGGTVTISCDNIDDGTLIPGLSKRAYVRLRVRDEGSGIEQSNLERIFDPYFSTKGKDANKGSGLGLAIVHSIVSKHGGLITVDSTVGEGSLFTVYMPAVPEAQPVSEYRTDTAAVFGKGRVLVMDDNRDICNVARNMLDYLGYESEEVYNGHDAVTLYERGLKQGERFDVAIMDLTIPGGMGAEEAVKLILAVDPKAKVIVSSGYVRDVVLENYQAYGFCANVSKPYQLSELSSVLKKVLDG
ncbi:MAG: hypothetical protein CSA26_07355 [Desulfobacterales bacterium]|nr:MAG: hypothetical protein CSA26_07355 [Desulfobacterales bacterium]